MFFAVTIFLHILLKKHVLILSWSPKPTGFPITFCFWRRDHCTYSWLFEIQNLLLADWWTEDLSMSLLKLFFSFSKPSTFFFRILLLDKLLQVLVMKKSLWSILSSLMRCGLLTWVFYLFSLEMTCACLLFYIRLVWNNCCNFLSTRECDWT